MKGKSPKVKVKVKPVPGLPAAKATALITLARKLGGAPVAAEVGLAAGNPVAYLAKFKQRMDDINVDKPRADLAWLALTQGLAARKKLVELDWKHEADDALHWVQRLAGAAGKKALAPVAKDPRLAERRTDEGLEQFGGALASARLALIELDKCSDSYAVMVVPAADVKPLAALARRGGQRIEHVTGKKFAAIEQERQRSQKAERARETSANRWTRLCERNWRKNTDGVLWTLRHHPYPVEAIREASADAPARDRPLIAMALALHDQPPTRLARTTKEPALCLQALRYYGLERFRPDERVGAAAILAERLRIKPGNGKLQQQVVLACNLFADDKLVDRAVVKLAAAARDRLARIADAYLEGTRHQSERWNDAYRALRSIGDETSIAAIEASRSRVWPDFKDHVIEEIETALTRIRGRAAGRP